MSLHALLRDGGRDTLLFLCFLPKGARCDKMTRVEGSPCDTDSCVGDRTVCDLGASFFDKAHRLLEGEVSALLSVVRNTERVHRTRP